MVIISISLEKKLLEKLDILAEQEGFSGRSDIIRVAIRDLISDLSQSREVNGVVNAIMIIQHNENVQNTVSYISHIYSDIIVSRQQHCVDSKEKIHTCVEIFFLSGEFKKIKKFNISLKNKVSASKLFILHS